MMLRPSLRSRGLVISRAILLLVTGPLMAQQSGTAKNNSIFVTSGQEITPTAAPGSNLLYLNPGLADFPKYIASGGVSSVVSRTVIRYWSSPQATITWTIAPGL